MRLPRPILGVLLVTSALSASCSRGGATGKASPGPSASASASTSSATASNAVKAFLADKTKPMTPAVEEQLLLALKACKVDDNGIQPRCPAYQTLNGTRSRRWQIKDPLAAGAAIGRRHIGDASPAVRLRSARLMGGIAGKSATMRELLVAAARKERVPGVLIAMLRVLGAHQHEDAGLSRLLLQMADNASPQVRMEAMGWILSPAGAGIDGGFKKVSEKLDADPSMRVRTYLCGRLYGSGDPRAIDAFRKYLLAKDTPPRLAQGCFRGLISAWTGLPRPGKPLKQAYELTLEVLAQKPRTKQRPPFAAISSLGAARTDFRPANKSGAAWLEKVKPWYKKARLVAVLESLAGDLEAQWLARASALDVMRQLGAPKAAFERVLSHYAKATGQDAAVKQRIQAIIRGTLVAPRTVKAAKAAPKTAKAAPKTAKAAPKP